MAANSLPLFADDVDQAIQRYQSRITANDQTLTWFIPFRSFADPAITGPLYGCRTWPNCDEGGECCTKSMLFPIFYVTLPIVQFSLEIAATPTVRICALPFLFYLVYQNASASKMIAFLAEIKTYEKYKAAAENDTKKTFYLNSTQLRPAFEEFRAKIAKEASVSVSHYISRVEDILKTNQYRFNDDLWSVDDFIVAAKNFENDDDSFSVEDGLVEYPENAECVVCMENRVSQAFAPCGHFVACEACFAKLDKDASRQMPICPKCRAPVESRLKIFQ